MIRALRSRHRWMTAGMGVVAIAGLSAGVASRPRPAVMSTLPDVLLRRSSPTMARPNAPPRAAGDQLWKGARLHTVIYDDVVELSVRSALYRPAPLVYWTPADTAGSTLHPRAVLLGALTADRAPQRLPLPSPTGALVLFSLAHGEVFARLPLPSETSK